MGGADGEACIDQVLQLRILELSLLLFVRETGEVVLVQLIGQSLKIGMVADRCQIRCLAPSFAVAHGLKPLPQALGQK